METSTAKKLRPAVATSIIAPVSATVAAPVWPVKAAGCPDANAAPLAQLSAPSAPFGPLVEEVELSEVERDAIYFLRSSAGSPLALPECDLPAYREMAQADGVTVAELEADSREYHARRAALCDRLRAFIAAVEG